MNYIWDDDDEKEQTGIEPATIGSAIPCSTTELLFHCNCMRVYSYASKNNLDGIRTRNPQIRSLMRYPIAPRGHTYVVKPMVRFELTTLCLQSRCNNHYATSAQWLIICVLPEVGFEPTHPKIIELKSTALDRSAIQAQNQLVSQSSVDWRMTTAVRFELTRALPNRFRIYRLNHSAMLPHSIYVMVMLIQQPTTRRIRTYVQCNT